MVPAVQTQFKRLHLFHFGDICISVILLAALFFPLSSPEKSVRSVVGHKSIAGNPRVTWSQRSRSTLMAFIYLSPFLVESFQPGSIASQHGE